MAPLQTSSKGWRGSMLLAGLLAAGQTHAASITSGDRSIRATVATICDISGSASNRMAAGQLDFGEQLLIANHVAVTVPATTMLVQCNVANTTLDISFGPGSAADPSGTRHLSGPNGSKVPYALYRDASISTPWTGTPQSLLIATDQPTAIPIYGRLPALASSTPAGAYTDSVQVTIAY
jgi:spore coat protein U-like protein